MKKNVVFWVGVKNEKYSEKYGGWEWMDLSRKTWEYWCEKNDVLFFPFEEPIEKDLNKFLDKLSEEQLKRLLLSGGGRVIELSKYRKSKDPKIKKINISQGDYSKTVAGLSDDDKLLIKELLRKSGVLVGD